MKKILLSFIAIAAITIGTAGSAEPPPAAKAAIQATDATQEFVRFWDKAEGRPEAERVRLFREMVVAAHPELFTESVLGKQAPSGDDAAIAKYLRDVVPYVPKMRELAASIGKDLTRYAGGFSATFPDYASAMPIYFTVSLFSFDGGTRLVNGKMALLFGIDGIVRYQGPDGKLSVLFHHELFHQYHEQIAPELGADEAPIWVSLWEEGLATYVSQKMNPGTSDAQALFSATLVPQTQAVLPAAARELLANLDSLDKKEYASFFYGKNDRTDLPGRCGYYIGLLIARRLGEKRSLQQMALMRGPSLREEVKQALEQMAK